MGGACWTLLMNAANRPHALPMAAMPPDRYALLASPAWLAIFLKSWPPAPPYQALIRCPGTGAAGAGDEAPTAGAVAAAVPWWALDPHAATATASSAMVGSALDRGFKVAPSLFPGHLGAQEGIQVAHEEIGLTKASYHPWRFRVRPGAPVALSRAAMMAQRRIGGIGNALRSCETRRIGLTPLGRRTAELTTQIRRSSSGTAAPPWSRRCWT